MKRTFTLFAALVLLAVGAAAQKLSYQAVVRNSANELVYDATVTVSLKILAADGVTVQYAETQTATTNQNGLLTLIIGEHPTGTYSLASVNWTDASIKTEITLPTGDVVTNIMPVTAVPYALYADNTGGNLNQVQSDWAETNTASKAYIQNKPAIPTAVSQLTNDVNYITVNEVPTSISHYTNDANYITINDVPAQVNADWNATSGAAQILNKPAIPTVPTNVSAFNNDAGYLTAANVQEAANIPTNVSAFTNDAGYLTSYTETDPQFNAWDKDYNDLTNKPTIPTVPTNVSAFSNDANYITINDVPTAISHYTNDASYITINQVPTSISYYTNDANYITLNDVPAQVNADWNATSGAAQILNKPAIPTVPTNVSAFNNDAGYLTAANVQEAANIPTNVSAFTNDAGYLTSYTETDPQFNAWDKDYNDLTNKPAIPTVPTNVSAFSNDANYITINDVPTAISHYTNDANYITINDVPTSISYYTNDANYITLNDVPAQVNADWNATSGAAQILNKPAIPTVPTNVSAFTNDAGYLTGYTETQTLADVTANGNSAGNRQLKNVSDPTDAQDAVTKSYLAAQTDAITASIQQQFDNLASQYQQQLGALTNTFQHTLDSLGAVIGAQQATINAQQHQLDSLINSGSTPTPPTPAAPTATTGTATDVTENSATLNGSISNPDNVTVTAQGFEWKATEGGTYAAVNATGETMTYSLTGLTASTGYTYRAFVTTASGTVYGSEVTFTTAASTPSVTSSSPCTASATHAAQTGSAYQGNGYNGANHGLETVVNGKINSVTDYDGNEYPVVQIGSQCWLAENMRCTHSPLTGTYIVTPSSSGYTFTGKQARWYTGTADLNGNSVMMDSAACVAHKFGLLYNWNAAVDIYNTSYGELSINTSSNNAVNTTFTGNRQGICPTGWHVPTDDEWNAMELVVNGSDVSSYTGYRGTHAGKLAGGDDWNGSTTSGAPGDYTNTSRNSSGFSAVPAGNCYGSSFNYAGNYAAFWSSSQHEGYTYLAWNRGLDYSYAGVYRNNYGKYYGFSVRCLRN